MSAPRSRSVVMSVLSSIGWPLFWGLAAWVGFYALIQQGVLNSELARRYFAGHPVEYIESAMFFVAVAALAMKCLSVLRQHLTINQVQLPAADRPYTADASGRLLAALAALPAALQTHFLTRRLREALTHVERKGSADELDEQLKYLADVDAGRQHDSYALVRLVIWAIPILGFLGTVIGITKAISNLSIEALSESTTALTGSLSIAFDTTTVALGLSIVLMFAQFLVDRIETELLNEVDERAAAMLVGKFVQMGTSTDPQLASVRRMVESVIDSTDLLVQRQTELWQKTIDAAHRQWSQLSGGTARQLESALAGAMSSAGEAHAARLASSEQKTQQRAEQLMEGLQTASRQYAGALEAQHGEMTRQGEVLLKAVEATGRVTSLQKALNDNLQSLAGAGNFEETVMSLAAAIHLLNNRLGQTGAETPPVDLNANAKDRAA